MEDEYSKASGEKREKRKEKKKKEKESTSDKHKEIVQIIALKWGLIN